MPKNPVVASYIANFLKKDQLHVYRQIMGLKEVTCEVFTHKRENPLYFPFHFRRITVLPKPRTRWLRRFIHRQLLDEPWQMYRWELRRWILELTRVEARVLHIYFGHVAPQFIPLMRAWPHPVVVSFHGADAGIDMAKPRYAEKMREVLSLATRVLCRSESLAGDVIRLGCPPEKIFVQRTGIPLEDWAYAPRSAPADEAWNIVQSCRFIGKKGLDLTVTAFAEVLKRYPKATLTLIGDGPLKEQLEEQVAALGIANHVRFTGFIEESEVKREIAAAHLFVHPSRTTGEGDREGIPNAMLEAMATGLPIVSTRHGGIPEAVIDGESGLLVSENDSPALATAMLRVIEESELRQRLAAGARRSIETEFDRTTQIRRLEVLYKDLMQGACAAL